MGAVAVTNKKYGVYNNKKIVEADVTWSASYATGGDTLAIGALGLKRLDEIAVPSHDLITRKPVTAAGVQTGKTVQLGGTATAPLLKLYETAGTEVANATNVSTVVTRVRFFGA